MPVETSAEQLLFSVIHIFGSDGANEWEGTGFIHLVHVDNGTAAFLVTNKHVLAGATELRLKMVRAAQGNEGPALGVGSEATIRLVASDWLGHPNPQVDVAIMPLSEALDQLARDGKRPFFRGLGSEIFLTPEISQELDAIEEVFFIGYPWGIFDETNLLPVVRRGITATPISVDYMGEPAFLVDASVFEGSSGSPVFVLDRGTYAPRSGGLAFGDRTILLGVVAAVHVKSIQQEVRGVAKALGARLAAAKGRAKMVVNINEALDLGVVYKAWTIEECVDELLRQGGLTRRPGRPGA